MTITKEEMQQNIGKRCQQIEDIGIDDACVGDTYKITGVREIEDSDELPDDIRFIYDVESDNAEIAFFTHEVKIL